MTIKKRVTLSLVFSLAFTLTVSFLILYLISSQILERRLEETYRLVYENYKEILKGKVEESEKLKALADSGQLSLAYHYIEKASGGKCEETAYYRVTSIGLHYGINRQYPEGCFFTGVNIEEILRFMESLMGIDWVVYYDRDMVPEIVGGNLDTFMKDKVIINNIVIDRFSKQYVLNLPLNVKGYMLYGSFLEKKPPYGSPPYKHEGLAHR